MIEMIDITGLREDKRPQSSTIVHALLDRLEAAEKERDDVAQQLVQSEIGKREISEAHNAVTRRLSVLADENTALRAQIEAIHSLLDGDESKIIRNAKDGYPEGREPKELTLIERVTALCKYASDWKRWFSEAESKIAEMERQEPVGTLHDDGYFVWRKPAPYESNYAGWKTVLYALPGAQPAPSVPVAALRPVIQWLRNGCDPAKAADELEMLAPSVPEGWPTEEMTTAFARVFNVRDQSGTFTPAFRAALAAAPEAKP